MFWRRLVPFVLAMAIGIAPLAHELCQIECRGTTLSAAARSCHEHGAATVPADTPTLAAGPHVCDHDDGIPASSLVSAPVLQAATLTQVLSADSLSASGARRRAVTLTRLPIPPLLLPTPLRL